MDAKTDYEICMNTAPDRAVNSLVVAAIVCTLACGGCEKAATNNPSGDSAPTSPPQVVTANLPHALVRPSVKRQTNSTPPREVSIWDPSSAPAAVPKPARSTQGGSQPPPAGPHTPAHDLLARLAHIDLNHASISPKRAKEVNQLRRQWREQGAAAVPAIREFLQRNEDVTFDA